MKDLNLPIIIICLFSIFTVGLMSLIAWHNPLNSLSDTDLSEVNEQPVVFAQRHAAPLICTYESGEPIDDRVFSVQSEGFTCIPDSSPVL